MTIIDAPVVNIDDIDLDFESPAHIGCCLRKEFLCGATYHEEAECDEDTDDDEMCVECVDIRDHFTCEDHRHCPIRPSILCGHPFSRIVIVAKSGT